MKAFLQALRRLWQPRSGLFWMMLAVNGLSTGLVLYLQVVQPSGAVRWLFSLLALGDTLLGWWMLRRLWQEGAERAA